MKLGYRPAIALVVLVAALTGATACTAGSSTTRPSGSTSNAPSVASSAPSTATPIQVGGTRTLTGAERSYGASVGNIPGAVYQPDVVVIGGGAGSIADALDNGLVWTVKSSAPGASELAVGKIMVATSMATGRVEQVQRVADGVRVVLAPVGLTDVFKELDVGSSSAVPLSQPLAYGYGDSPFSATAGDSGVSAAPATTTASIPPSAPPAPRFLNGPGLGRGDPSLPPGVPSVTLAAPTVSPKAVHEGKFDLTPFCCYPSQGVHIAYNTAEGRMAATVGLVMGGQPAVDFHIVIDAGGLEEAVFQLNGPKAIEFQFDAATRNVGGNYRSPTLKVPFAFTFPILGIPFTVSLVQSVHASIQLAGQASFSAKGVYAMSGGLGFSYQHGRFGVTKPSFSGQISSLDDAESLSVGINALSIGYGMHFSIGIGVIGFNGGPFFDLDGTLAIDKDGSPTATSLTAGCAVAAVGITGSFGVGYTLPEFVTEAVNTFLGLFHAKPISSTGGFTKGPYTLWNPGPGKRCLQR
jgi:hypothetical protein